MPNANYLTGPRLLKCVSSSGKLPLIVLLGSLFQAFGTVSAQAQCAGLNGSDFVSPTVPYLANGTVGLLNDKPGCTRVTYASSAFSQTLESTTPPRFNVNVQLPPTTHPGSYTVTVTAIDSTTSISRNFTFTVVQASQTINFTNPGPRPLGTVPFQLQASASSGLPISFQTATPSVCGVSGNIATVIAAGTCSITASQAGNADYLAATAVTQAFSVGGAGTSSSASSTPSRQGAETVGRLIGQRANRLLTNQPEIDRMIDLFSDSGPASPGAGLADVTGPPTAASQLFRFGGGLGGDNLISSPNSSLHSRSSLGSNGPMVNPLTGLPLGSEVGSLSDPTRGFASVDASTYFGFSMSLSQVARYAAEQERLKVASGDGAQGLALKSGQQTAIPTAKPTFDLWVEGKYTGFRDNHPQRDQDGHFAMLTVGADYLVAPQLLIGGLLSYDSMSQRSSRFSNEANGRGWLAGPYAMLKLSKNLFWHVRAGWGQSNNEISPYLTYTDTFDADRWIVSSTLVGRWTHGLWTFKPQATLAYMEESAHSYIDTLGNFVPKVTSRLGQAKVGPEVSYRYQVSNDVVLEPRAGAQLIWNFSEELSAAGIGQLNGESIGQLGARGRAELGLRATTLKGTVVDVSASYDGIGASHYDAYTARAALRVPLQ